MSPSCSKCGEHLQDEDVVWVNPQTGEADGMYGDPYHVGCAPEERRMSGQNKDHRYAGRRFELVSMGDDPAPVEPGSTGTVHSAVDFPEGTHLNVDWDDHVKRRLNVILPEDSVRWLDDHDSR